MSERALANDPEQPDGSAPPTAVGIALSGASRTKADAFLDEQARVLREQAELIRLQKEQLREELGLRRWMLRFEHMSAGMKVAFEVAAAFIVVTIAAIVGGAVWSAADDNGLVVEAFSVPSDYASRGLSGQVLASHLLDRLSEMQAQTKSQRRAASYTNNWGDDIKVEIPTTGISFNELQRLLNAWLGHETRISGEVFRIAGGIAVSTRVGTSPAMTFEGKDGELDTLVTRAAEQVYKETQPYRYASYLLWRDRESEAERIFEQLAKTGSPLNRAWAYAGWSNLKVRNFDLPGALEKAKLAIATDPDLPQPYDQRGLLELSQGHWESALNDFRICARLTEELGRQYFDPDSVAWTLANARRNVAFALGDFRTAVEQDEVGVASRGTDVDRMTKADDLMQDHDVSQSLAVVRSVNTVGATTFLRKDGDRVLALIELEDWRSLAKINAARPVETRTGRLLAAYANIYQPGIAYGVARAGDVAQAEALISTTPLDCYGCLRERGDIAVVKRDWLAAEHWYAEAVRQAPTIPFAYKDWGAMLLTRGNYDDAIAKFAEAHEKGPHYADPLEMWGEALMLKNRSDLALAKFEEANKHAPRWGRLHLKWGEALIYLGSKDDARGQFHTTSGLDLSIADRATLARDQGKLHG